MPAFWTEGHGEISLCPIFPIFFKSLHIPAVDTHPCVYISDSLTACSLGLKPDILHFLIMKKDRFSFREEMLTAWTLLSQPLNLNLEAAPTHTTENLTHPSDVASYLYRLWIHLKQFIFVLTKQKCQEFTDQFKQRGGI